MLLAVISTAGLISIASIIGIKMLMFDPLVG